MKTERVKKPKKGFMDGYKTYDTSEGFGSPEQWKEAFEIRMNFCSLTLCDKQKNGDILTILHEAFKLKDKGSLQKAYHKLMKQYHPDLVGDNTEKHS